MNKRHFKILAVDDDATFLRILQQSMHHEQYNLQTAQSPEEAMSLLKNTAFAYAILDLNLQGQSGLNLLQALLDIQPNCKVLILTGYASVATAVEAMRLGAYHYLCKPASVEDIVKALDLDEPIATNANEIDTDYYNAMSVKRLEWEHIQKVLLEHDGNISATAQALNMHRRTLQRKLQKRPVEK